MISFRDADTAPFEVGGLENEKVEAISGVTEQVNFQQKTQDVIKRNVALQNEIYVVNFKSAILTSDQVAWFENALNKELFLFGTLFGTISCILLGDVVFTNITKLNHICSSYDFEMSFAIVDYLGSSSGSSSSSSSSSSTDALYLVDESGNFIVDENDNNIIGVI